MSLQSHIMNMPCDLSATAAEYHSAVKVGHKMARHQAAELAGAADFDLAEAVSHISTLLGLHLAHHNLPEHAAARAFVARIKDGLK